MAGIPIGIVVLVGLPFAVSKPAEPQPRESALTVRLSGGEGAYVKQAAYVPVRAEGNDPTPGELADSTGRHAAEVASTPGKCAGVPSRSIGLPPGLGRRWCLQLTSVDPGVTFTGSVSASNPPAGSEFTKLALTVTRRDSFWPLPLLSVRP